MGLPEPTDELDMMRLSTPGKTLEGPLKRASDTQLFAAHRKLFDSEWVECVAPWQPGYFRVFASHVSSDKVLASGVRYALRPFGIDVFVAHIDIEPTEDWQRIIEGALDTCDMLVAFLTPKFHESLWTDQEVGFVFGRRKLVLPLMLGAAPYGFLGKKQGLAANDSAPEQLAERIFDTLLKRADLSDRLAEGLLTALEASTSFDESRKRLTNLRRVPRWPKCLAAPLKAAHAFNDQVGGRGVPELINDVLSRIEPSLA